MMMGMNVILLVVTGAGLFHLTGSSSILVIHPMPVPSHHRVYQPIVRGLLDRGHSVTYLSPYPLNPTSKPGQSYTEILIKDYMDDIKRSLENKFGMSVEPNFLQQIPFQQQLFILSVRIYGVEMGRFYLRDPNFKSLINSDNKFDCIIYAGTFMHEVLSALTHRFQAPLIELHPTGNFHFSYWLHGNPYDPSYIVDFTTDGGDHMNLLERIENTVNSFLVRWFWYGVYWSPYEALMNEEFRYPGWENRPSMKEMIANTSLVLVNTHYSLSYPYPMSPNFKEIGGINILDAKPLPQDIHQYMDSASEGVIYFSLGSHIKGSSTLAGGVKDAFARAFSKVKQKVLWKWEENFHNLPPNVKISKWFPQQEILSHKNCKLFITHGGFLSLSESLYNGIPMIGIPLIADQIKNVHHIQFNKYGVRLSPANLTEESVSWAINEVINNPMYKSNAQTRSILYRDKPETALETAMYWIEYVIRHKGAHHLKPAVVNMPWYQEAMLDVYAALTIIFLLPLFLTYKLLSCICRVICSRKKCNTKIEKKKKYE